MRKLFGLGAALATIWSAPPAFALDAKQCLPIAEMNATLKAEGQRSLVVGDRMALNNAPERSAGVKVTRYANIVTSNADGSLGYQMEGDLPRAQASTGMCVRAKLTNVRLYDAGKPGLNRAALLGDKFDYEAEGLEKMGTRPMVIADTVHRNDDGSERQGLPMVLFGNTERHSGSMYTKRADGVAIVMMVIENPSYTPEALRRLSQ